MTGFVDIHSHILPAIDDGAQTADESVAILEAAWTGGTRQIVATPHMFRPNLGADERRAVEAAYGRWRELVGEAAELPVVHLGAENYVSTEFAEALNRGEVLPLAGSRYLLVEFWPMTLPGAARNALAAIQDAGFVPVVAHAERYGFLQEQPDLLAQFVEAGVVAQVNAGAILGRQGLRLARLADRWLRRGWVSVVASDSHSIDSRPPDLAEVATFLESRFGGETATLCLRDNPGAIINDGAVLLPPPGQVRRWWRRRSKNFPRRG